MGEAGATLASLGSDLNHAATSAHGAAPWARTAGVTLRRVDSTEAHPLDEWVAGIRAGSNTAYRAVYHATADDLASFAFGMLRDRGLAEDVVQLAFLELARAAGSFRGGGESLRVWLFRSVRFRCLDEMKRASRRYEHTTETLPEREQLPAEPGGIEPRLDRALAALSPRQRQLVTLRHVVGLSGEEVAAVMGVSRPAAYAALARAERRLKASYHQQPSEETTRGQ